MWTIFLIAEKIIVGWFDNKDRNRRFFIGGDFYFFKERNIVKK